MSNARCKRCSAPITWAHRKDGRAIALTKAVAYETAYGFENTLEALELLSRTGATYVSHVLVCPKSGEFQATKKRRAPRDTFAGPSFPGHDSDE